MEFNVKFRVQRLLPATTRGFLSAKRLLFLIMLSFSLVPASAHAQAFSESVLYAPPSYATGVRPDAPLIQAYDGNFYGVDEDTSPTNATGSGIFRISPSGEYQLIYTFPALTTSFNELTQGSDGALYGTTSTGGNADGDGLIFKITLSGDYSPLYTFCSPAPPSNDCADGTSPSGQLVQGSDGNFYGTTQSGGANLYGTVFQLTPEGQFTTIYSFCSAKSCSDGSEPLAGLVEGTDGYLYGTTAYGGQLCGASTAGCGTVFKITPSGTLTVVHNFTGGEDGWNPESSLVEGPDGSFYGATGTGPNGSLYGAVFKLSTDGTVTSIYNLTDPLGFPTYNPVGPIFGSDGNLYGTIGQGGAYGGGSVYLMDTSGDAVTIYSFCPDIQNNFCPDGADPYVPPIQGSDGNFYGTTGLGGVYSSSPVGPGTPSFGTVYELAASPALAPPVQLTFSNQTPQPGQAVTLNWSVANAYSKTLQQCYAFVQGSPAGAGNWTGLQSGTFTASSVPPLSGSASITPTADGVYVYALTCGGTESGLATLIVGTPPALEISTTSLSSGQVGVAYSQAFQATGGVPPYKWSLQPGTQSDGLQLSTRTGTFAGIPLTYGNFPIVLQVTDSNPTPQVTTANLSLTVLPLTLTIPATSLAGGTVGQAYSQTLQANGGIAPYKWTLTSGALPSGLTLSEAGIISGTPSSAGVSLFHVEVTDSENKPQSATAGLSIVVTTTPLQVVTQSLPNAVYGTVYSQLLQASGGAPPYSWTVAAGALPPGLSLNQSTGSISGSPTSVTASTFTLQVADSESPQSTADAVLSLAVQQAAQSIAFATLPNSVTYGVAPLPLTATSSSGLPVTFSVVSGPATVAGSMLTITGGGTVVVAANQAGNADYAAAPRVTQTIIVGRATQTVAFTSPASPVTFGVGSIVLSATASSGLPVTFSVVSGPATVTGSKLTITGAGIVVLAANQAGNASYAPANEVTRTLTVEKASQTIHFDPLKTPVVYGVAPIALSATTGSRLSVRLEVRSGPAKVEDSKLLILGAGEVTVEASQAGDANYLPAAPVVHTIVVDKAKLTVAANDLTMKHGSPVPKLTYKISGFVDGDTQSKATKGEPLLSTSATSKSPPGTYKITATVGTLESKSYVLKFEDGRLTVTK